MTFVGRWSCQVPSVHFTTEERILIAVVSTVVVAIAQIFRVDADVGVVTLHLTNRTRPVS